MKCWEVSVRFGICHAWVSSSLLTMRMTLGGRMRILSASAVFLGGFREVIGGCGIFALLNDVMVLLQVVLPY
jgi:hypothetical protein